jgi:HAE1 family hydrophobic/amphiphilic exporter-1
LDEVERLILANRENIEAILVTFGYDVTNIKRSDEGEHSGRFKILVEGERRVAETEERVLTRLRAYFSDIPDIDVRLTRPVLFSAETPIEVEIMGDDLRALKTQAQRAEEIMAGLPELADVETTLKTGAPEIQVLYERDRLMRYDLKIDQVAASVRDMVKGFEATLFNLQDRRVPILVRLEESDREYIEDVGRLTVNAGGEHPIPLHAIASLEVGEGPSEVRRVDGNRVALVQANIASGSLGSAVTSIETALAEDMEWPPDMNFRITGQNEEWERSQGSLYLALGLSLFLVYVIMAAQFESLLQPFIIMFTIPLAFFGTVVGLKLLNISVSIVVFLGMIMLVGIVVNNAIVLIDYANTLRRRGLPLGEAITTAGSVRLRPILMTTATTVLGLLPMALGLGDGAEIRTPMAVTVICGLITSTVLTLGIIPTLYYLLEGLKLKLVKEPVQGE